MILLDKENLVRAWLISGLDEGKATWIWACKMDGLDRRMKHISYTELSEERLDGRWEACDKEDNDGAEQQDATSFNFGQERNDWDNECNAPKIKIIVRDNYLSLFN